MKLVTLLLLLAANANAFNFDSGGGGGSCATTPGYTYNATGPIVNLDSGFLTVGGATTSTIAAAGYLEFPKITAPSAALGRFFFESSTRNLKYSPDGSTFVTISTATGSGGGGSPAGTDGDFQAKSGTSFVGASFLAYTGGQVKITTQTVVGVDQAHCGAMFTAGVPSGTLRCANAGNDYVFNPFLFQTTGGGDLVVTDWADSMEVDLGNTAAGGHVWPNISSEPMSLGYSTKVPAIRLGGTGVITMGRVASQDAGSNAGVYINFPSTAAVGGMIYSSVASTNTIANTTEIGLYEVALPAGILKNNGDCLVFVCGAAGAATATTKDLRIRFNNATLSAVGGTILADTGAVTSNNVMLNARARLCKSGSNAQVLVETFAQAAGTTATMPAPPSLAVTDTAAINVSCTGQNGTGNAADLVGKAFTIEYLPAP